MGYTVNSVVINKGKEELFLIINNVKNWPELHGYKSVEVRQKNKLKDGKTKIVFQVTGNEENGRVESWVSQRIIDPIMFSARGVRLEPMFPFRHWILDVVLTEEMNGTRMTWIQDFSMDERFDHSDEEVEKMINQGSKEELRIFKEKIEDGTVNEKVNLEQ